MAIELRYPHVPNVTEREQLAYMKSYLHQLVDQLQIALNNIGSSTTSVVTSAQKPAAPSVIERTDPAVTFNSIKSLIIKSADIVNSYYDQINTRLNGVYVAESDFGTYAEQTSQEIEQTSTKTDQLFENIQVIETEVENLAYALIETNAYIRSGLLYTGDNGVPMYGLEIGQKVVIEDEEVFRKFARFTADRLSFYDQNGSEVAYISDYKLYIRNVEITSSYKIGGLVDTVMSTGDVVTKWVGRG